MRVYVSGALHGAESLEAAREKYEKTAILLAEGGFSAYLPHKQTDPVWARNISSVDVFSEDVQALLDSDVVLAFLDEPSLGVGAEIALAIERGKVVFGAHRHGQSVSRFIEGLLISRGYAIIKYDSLNDVVRELMAFCSLAR